MVFGAVVNGIDSLISLSTVSVFKKETDFCALIFVPCHVTGLLHEF